MTDQQQLVLELGEPKVAAELVPADEARAELARRHHEQFMRFCWQKPEPFLVGAHTRAICQRIDRALDDFAAGRSTYLVIAVPFRHGKSDMVSRFLPAHFLGRFPSEEVMLATYASTLSTDFSRFARNLLSDPQYQLCYPGVEVSRISSSVHHWEIGDAAGGMTAVGLGGALTGRGYACGAVDDYHRNRSEAESATLRTSRWEAFTNDFLTRRAPVSITMVVATPWHVDDVIGRIKRAVIEDPKFPRFEFLRFPAFDDSYPSGVLFPERFGVEWYDGQRATLGTYGAASLLQCDPVPRGGNIFQTDMIDVVEADQVPDNLRWCRGWDLASTVKQRVSDDPDYTAGCLGAVQRLPPPTGYDVDQPIEHLWIRDCVRLRAEAPARDRTIKRAAVMDGSRVLVAGESVAGYKDTFTNLRAALHGVRNVRKITPRHELMVRTAPIEPIVEAGHLHLVRGDWNADFVAELQSFPGPHDDQVAALVTMYEALRRRRQVDVT